MKKKANKITLKIAYKPDAAVHDHISKGNAAEFKFDLVDGETILFTPSKDESYKLHLEPSAKKDKDCLTFLSQLSDLSKLQPEFDLMEGKIKITFFTNRLTEEEIDKALFEGGLSAADIDSKIMIGLILNNRYHG